MVTLKTVRIIAWSGVALVAALLGGFTLLPREGNDARNAQAIAISEIGGPFSLTAHTGETIDNARLAGKPYLVFFGFTHCPDVCPTTLFELTSLMKELGPAADRFNALFVTVDPERDSQELLALYMTAFDPRILAVRGDRAATDAAVKAFRAYARKVPSEGGEYTMDHTAGVYVMDADGRFTSMLDMHESQDARLQKLRRIAGAES